MSKLEFNSECTVSIYPSVQMMNKMGYKSMYDMSDDLESVVKINYPGLLEEGYAQFDPESAGFMVYCATEEIAQVINEELNEMVDSGLQDDIKNRIKSLEEEINRLKKLLK